MNFVFRPFFIFTLVFNLSLNFSFAEDSDGSTSHRSDLAMHNTDSKDSSVQYAFFINPYQKRIKNETTKNKLEVIFWSNNRILEKYIKTPVFKSGYAKWAYSTSNYTDSVTKITVRILGTDAMFVDFAYLTVNGQRQNWGRNGGSGICLSADKNDAASWKPYHQGCKSSVKFKLNANIRSSVSAKLKPPIVDDSGEPTQVSSSQININPLIKLNGGDAIGLSSFTITGKIDRSSNYPAIKGGIGFFPWLAVKVTDQNNIPQAGIKVQWKSINYTSHFYSYLMPNCSETYTTVTQADGIAYSGPTKSKVSETMDPRGGESRTTVMTPPDSSIVLFNPENRYGERTFLFRAIVNDKDSLQFSLRAEFLAYQSEVELALSEPITFSVLEGNNQTLQLNSPSTQFTGGTANPQDIKVLAVDADGKPTAGIPVWFNVQHNENMRFVPVKEDFLRYSNLNGHATLKIAKIGSTLANSNQTYTIKMSQIRNNVTGSVQVTGALLKAK